MLRDLSTTNIIIVLISLIISIAIHESVHALVARRLGDRTASDLGRITINPLKHVDIYTTILLPLVMMLLGMPPIFIAKPVPFDPSQVRHGEYGAAMVAVAGPVSNFCLAAVAALLLRIVGTDTSLMIYESLVLFMNVNLGLFIFNMIPIPPLDGSRLLYAFAPEPIQAFMERIEAMGFLALVLIIFLLSPILGPILGNIDHALISFLL